jgi:hypothetical protein
VPQGNISRSSLMDATLINGAEMPYVEKLLQVEVVEKKERRGNRDIPSWTAAEIGRNAPDPHL